MEPLRFNPSLPPIAANEEPAAAENVKPNASAASATPESSGAGKVFQPSGGDEVLIAFENGDPRTPFVLGGLWNAETPPLSASSASKDNAATGGAPPPAGAEEPGTTNNRLLEERAKFIGRHLEP